MEERIRLGRSKVRTGSSLRSLLWVGAPLALLASPAEAQVVLGVRGGPSVSTHALGAAGIETNWLRRSSFGAWLCIPIAGSVSLQAGAFRSQKGSRQTEGDVTGSFLLDYVDIPVLLSLRAADLGPFRTRLFAGAAYSRESDCWVQVGTLASHMGATCGQFSEFVGLERHSSGESDLGIVTGAGLDFTGLPLVWLTFDATYNHGLREIDPTDYTDSRNRSVTFHVGLALPFG